MSIQFNIQDVENKNPSNILFWSSIGGVIVGTITSIALGIIFGPFSALAGFCAGGMAGMFIATIIYSCSTTETRQLPEVNQPAAETTVELYNKVVLAIHQTDQILARLRNNMNVQQIEQGQ